MPGVSTYNQRSFHFISGVAGDFIEWIALLEPEYSFPVNLPESVIKTLNHVIDDKATRTTELKIALLKFLCRQAQKQIESPDN